MRFAQTHGQPLPPFVDVVDICPEVEIGLGVPRPPVRLVRLVVKAVFAGTVGIENQHFPRTEVRLVQPESGRDLTETIESYAADRLRALPNVDDFLLKSASPSCGIKGVKVYVNGTPSPERRAGVFGAARWSRTGWVASSRGTTVHR